MIKLLFLGMLAAASAAPRRYHHHRHSPYFEFDQRYNMDLHPAFGEEMFDTNRFWADMETQMRALDDMLANFHRRFPTLESTAGVVGNEYKVTIPLAGFHEKDIVVKAREGVLMVQAKHQIDEASSNSYLDVRTLPKNVNAAGVWMYQNNLLTIVFPLTDGAHEVTTETATPEHETATASREEMDKTPDTTNEDADVGLRSDNSKENEIKSNAIEATTYAVDLKNEVEFVPVHYR